MRGNYIAALATWQAIAGTVTRATPVQLKARQGSESAANGVTSPGAPMATDPPAAAGASASPDTTVAVTQYIGSDGGLGTAPVAAPTAAPSSGCVLASQTSETVTQILTYPFVGSVSYAVNIFTISDGTFCTCAGGAQADLASSFNPEGTMFLYCATCSEIPTSFSNAVSTVDPKASARPGDPLNPAWAEVTCDYGSLPNVGGKSDPSQMWNDSGAEAAWNSMYASWSLDQTTTNFDIFSDYLINYFHGPVRTGCSQLVNSGCNGPASCGQYTTPNAVINSPAGYMIWASMTGLHKFFEAFYDGVGTAATQWALNLGQFTSVFSPILDDLAAIDREKQTLDVVLLVTGVLAVALFEVIAPSLSLFRVLLSSTAGSRAVNGFKTEFYLNFGATLGLVKGRMTAPTFDSVTADVGSYISAVSTNIQRAITEITAAIYDSPQILHGMVDDGQFFGAESATTGMTSAFDISQKMQQLILANALPMIWSTGVSVRMPFIATGSGVGNADASGCEGYDPTKFGGSNLENLLNGQLTDTAFEPNAPDPVAFYQSVFYCVDNAPYWFMTGRLNDNYQDQPYLILEQPTNIDSLDGGDAWAGLTGEAMVASAVNTWIQNGKQNNAALADPSNYDQLETWATVDVAHITGLVKIPVCSFDQARQGVKADATNAGKNPSWPCPASGTTG